MEITSRVEEQEIDKGQKYDEVIYRFEFTRRDLHGRALGILVDESEYSIDGCFIFEQWMHETNLKKTFRLDRHRVCSLMGNFGGQRVQMVRYLL